MPKKKRSQNKIERSPTETDNERSLHPHTKASVLAVIGLGLATILILAGFGKAGPAGELIFKLLHQFLGWGYYLLPVILILLGFNVLTNIKKAVMGPALIGAGFFVASGLSIIDIIYPGKAGLAGNLLGSLEILFGSTAALVIDFTIIIVSILIILNAPLHLKLRLPKIAPATTKEEPTIIMPESPPPAEEEKQEVKLQPAPRAEPTAEEKITPPAEPVFRAKHYVFPPLKLLKSSTEKPTVGDLRANANIIKRTLESFGIPVEMGEITIGPKVTRYTLKPAEGIKLSRITALNQDLSLALAAHPIRIEAPIPGRSLVGIEIPNKVGSLVRLGSLLGYAEFKKNGLLTFPLGRDVTGEPIFANLARMPHLLIAGSTGSGKSVAIHSLIISLLYKNSPDTLRLILIDPKRVELSHYEGIPHLITPVITEGKRAIAVLRFAIQEMENRYEILLKAGKRDIQSYNSGRPKEPMPYLLIIIDELADLMSAFGREVEASVVRLAQMARATGIHLIVSTQRPSVEVITGLIKANITSRIALQVASQIDSRTILDMAGAEKLLGGGDMLFLSAEIGKPKRIQGAYLSEEEINAVVTFIKKENPPRPMNHLAEEVKESFRQTSFEDFLEEEVDDELYHQALEVVKSAGKASASLLQRRLKIGYARAARLLDIMEERGIIGPAEGAKPRPLLIDSQEDF
jgi:S-DNA-T family DNA segregation ATPase FtsK/SpoIIIE